MRVFIVMLLLFSPYLSAWELQYVPSCSGWRLITDSFTLCLPDQYTPNLITVNEIGFHSKVEYDTISINLRPANSSETENENKWYEFVKEVRISDLNILIYKTRNSVVAKDESVYFGKLLVKDSKYLEIVVAGNGSQADLEKKIESILKKRIIKH